MGEVSMGTGDGDGDEREWVCDSGAYYHMRSGRGVLGRSDRSNILHQEQGSCDRAEQYSR